MVEHHSPHPPSVKPMVISVLIAVFLILGFTIPSPYLIERPGPVVNTLGDVVIDGEEQSVIEVEGADTFQPDGELNLLTLTTVGNPDKPLGWFSLIPTLFDESQTLRPMSEVFREGFTPEQRSEANRLMMERSQAQATAAALALRGIEYEATLSVTSISEGAPAAGLLETGDVLISMDDVPVSGMEALKNQISMQGDDTPAKFTILREGETRVVQVLPERIEGQNRSVIGVTLETEFNFPLEVTVLLDQIGGPSAGMIFSLAIYDELTPGSMTGGLTISGTGTIDENGVVGAIGGLPQKIWAASRAESDLFIMPIGNCVDIPANLPKDLTIAVVSNVHEALDAIQKVQSGATPPGIESCDSVIAQHSPVG